MSEQRHQPRLRVGVTGHRDIATRYPERRDAICRLLESVLATVSDALPGGDMRIVSPLADGVDRLAAQIAHGLGYRLLAPLPFPQGEYEKDFAASSLSEFRLLIARAQMEDGVVELGGSRTQENSAYLGVGEYVIAHVDMLIAVWDETRPNLPGGTGDIVQRALERGVAVVWISPSAPERAHLLVGPDGSARPHSEIVPVLDCLFARKSLDSINLHP
jgi:hypothetical protein